jgi:hypothetical protein
MGDVVELPINESHLTTSNTKLAATLLVFGFRLRKTDPLYWTEHYQKAEIDRLGWRDAPMTPRCYFNFDINGAAPREIATAFEGKNADTAFLDYLNRLDLPDKEKSQLAALHSNAVSQGCREAMEQREYLVRVIKDMPEDAKWQVVHGEGKAHVTFGKNASLETKIKLLAKL